MGLILQPNDRLYCFGVYTQLKIPTHNTDVIRSCIDTAVSILCELFFIPIQRSELTPFPTVTMAYDSSTCERPTAYAYIYTSIHHHMVDLFPFTVGIEFASS